MNFKSVLINWKTTLAGFLPLIIIGWNCYVEKRWPSNDETALIVGALGLGGAAKDGNVTGGTVPQATIPNPPVLPAPANLAKA